MEVKKTHPGISVRKEKPQASLNNVWEFFGDVKQEVHKITWTSPEELKVYTKIVIGATFILGFGIFCIDFTIQGALSFLSSAIRLIIG